LVTDDQRRYGSIYLQKADEAGIMVSGAEYGLFDAAGTDAPLRTLTTTSDGWLLFEDVTWGEYFIKEVKAPKGYELNPETYPVTVDRWNARRPIIVDAADERLKGALEILKVSEGGAETPLSNAVFTLYSTAGAIIEDDLKTNVAGLLRIEDIPWGSYYLIEKEAPEGYGLNPDKIRFSVNFFTAGIVQYLTVTDPMPTYQLSVTKKIKAEDIVSAHGEPTFIFRAYSAWATNGEKEYFRAVTFSDSYVATTTPDENGYIQLTALISGLPAGEYEVTEQNVVRYEFESASLGEGTSGNIQGAKATVQLNSTNETAEVFFTNDKPLQRGVSHTSVNTNVIKKQRTLTAVVADWHGNQTITEYLDRSGLDVYAIYDDGSQEKLADDAYELKDGLGDPAEPLSEAAWDMTIYAYYTEGGITRYGAFTLSANAFTLFKWEILTEEPFDGEDGKHYSGTAAITGYTGSSPIVNFPSWVRGHWENVVWNNLGNETTGYYYELVSGDWVDDGKYYLVTQLGYNESSTP
jgi:hypothetical protein